MCVRVRALPIGDMYVYVCVQNMYVYVCVHVCMHMCVSPNTDLLHADPTLMQIRWQDTPL